jgi:hypothetical protein
MLAYSLFKLHGFTERMKKRFAQSEIEGRKIAGILDSKLYTDIPQQQSADSMRWPSFFRTRPQNGKAKGNLAVQHHTKPKPSETKVGSEAGPLSEIRRPDLSFSQRTIRHQFDLDRN